MVMAMDGGVRARCDSLEFCTAVKHALEPFGRDGELGGLGSTRTHRPDLF